jgi:hypothetical protein
MGTISFGGQQITRPGAYSVVDTSQMVVSSVGSFRALGFVGVAPALKAGTDVSGLLVFNSQTTADAVATLGEGDLLTNMQIAWKHGADLIYVSVAVPATQGQPPTDADWQTAIDKLQYEYIDGIVPITSTGAIISKVDAHVTAMSGVTARKERRGFYGHLATATITDITTLVNSANDERAVFASPAPFDYNVDGSKLAYADSVPLASAYAGIWAGQDPQEPITYKYVKFAGLQKQYLSTDIATLLNAGVAVTEVTRKGFRIVQGVTAAAGSSDLTQAELSVSTLKDVMSGDMRTYMEDKYVGHAGVAGIEITIYNDAISRIEEYKKNNWISDYDPKSVKVVQNGTAFNVDWQGSPTLPMNDFFITSHFVL